jgi:PAS domain S-box-containing protein
MGGYSPEELERIPLSDRYLNVEDRRRFLEMARKGPVRNFEVELKRKNGEHYWVAMAAIPQTTDFGAGVITISEDITERKRAEERIRYLATFPEFNPTLILEMTRQGKVTYTNPALRSVFPGIEGSGKKHEYLADFTSFEEATNRNSEKPFSREVNVGDAFYEQVIHYLKETECFRVYGRDITERKKLEQELRSASLYARSLIEASLDPLVTINRDGKITDVNRATEQATGLARHKLIGNDFSDYFTEPEKAKDGYHEVFARGYVRDYPLTMRNISGKTTSVLYNATVYRDEDGETGGVFAAARDVTELKRLETELRRSNADLQQLAYITSHDLQEPLRMITSYLQLIERRYKGRLDADADEFIGYAVNGAARMRTMINDLLEYSRIGTRVQVLQPTSTESAFAAALANLEIAIRENAATVTHDPLPVIKADPTQFTMLFQNLIGNGIKFHGRDAPHLHVSARKEAGEWVFSVSDNGIGIEPQYFRRLFQVFQRLHTRDEYPGTGIGLALCKRIVERHGGRIWVESAAGKGATFYFTMPLEGKEPL